MEKTLTGACLVFISSVSSFILDVPSPDNLLIFTDQTKDIHAGSEVRLQCVVNLSSNTKVKWASTLGCLPDNAHTENHNMTLVITNFRSSDTGEYICVATNGTKHTSHVFMVQSNRISSSTSLPGKKPNIDHIVINPNRFHYGETVRIRCRVSGNPKPSVSWEMLVDPMNIPNNLKIHAETDGSTLTITNYAAENDAGYRCHANNMWGDAIGNVTLQAVA